MWRACGTMHREAIPEYNSTLHSVSPSTTRTGSKRVWASLPVCRVLSGSMGLFKMHGFGDGTRTMMEAIVERANAAADAAAAVIGIGNEAAAACKFYGTKYKVGSWVAGELVVKLLLGIALPGIECLSEALSNKTPSLDPECLDEDPEAADHSATRHQVLIPSAWMKIQRPLTNVCLQSWQRSECSPPPPRETVTWPKQHKKYQAPKIN